MNEYEYKGNFSLVNDGVGVTGAIEAYQLLLKNQTIITNRHIDFTRKIGTAFFGEY